MRVLKKYYPLLNTPMKLSYVVNFQNDVELLHYKRVLDHIDFGTFSTFRIHQVKPGNRLGHTKIPYLNTSRIYVELVSYHANQVRLRNVV